MNGPGQMTADEREMFEERMAICTIDGHVPEHVAERIAWSQVIEKRKAEQRKAAVNKRW